MLKLKLYHSKVFNSQLTGQRKLIWCFSKLEIVYRYIIFSLATPHTIIPSNDRTTNLKQTSDIFEWNVSQKAGETNRQNTKIIIFWFD